MTPLSHDIEILRELTSAELEQLTALTQLRRYERDQTVLREGEPADALYVLLSGAMRVAGVVVEGDELFERDEQKVVHLGPGEVFGELSFLTGDPPALSVIAEEPSEVAALPQAELHELLARQPVLGRKLQSALVRAMVRRLRSTSRELFLTRYFVRDR